MGDRESAAQALAHMPRWVAVHENTLAKLDVIVAVAGSVGCDVDDILRELDVARREQDRAAGVVLDRVTPPDKPAPLTAPDVSAGGEERR